MESRPFIKTRRCATGTCPATPAVPTRLPGGAAKPAPCLGPAVLLALLPADTTEVRVSLKLLAPPPKAVALLPLLLPAAATEGCGDRSAFSGGEKERELR